MPAFLKALNDRQRIISSYASALVTYLIAALSPVVEWFSLLTWIGFAVTFVLMLNVVRSDAHRVMNDPSDKLDEREIAYRDRAFRWAYIGFASLTSLIAVYWFIAADSERFWLPSTSLQYIASFWLFWFVAYTLPDAVYAFNAPQPIQEKDA
ncbi:hypothetical protein CEN41_01550 [Fischerella thermalis CCMEE 5330]|uniref:Uncharacterized protein n=1 Tax=Fischerella thermalis CCMEE 5330 TaxID=2019670 RepID=A0A2N6MNC0_9CYAN|nr:hypothetical protein CEN41_01550 [Fischerella thermalis CCMEE 5330]